MEQFGNTQYKEIMLVLRTTLNNLEAASANY